MKTASAGMTTHIAGENTTLVRCIKIKRTDGVIFAGTEHDQAIPFDLSDGDGEITYSAALGYLISAIQGSASFAADNFEMTGPLDPAGVTEADIDAKLYSHASIELFYVNHETLADLDIKIRKGFIGEIEVKGDIFVAEGQGLMGVLAQEGIELFTPDCRADLGDTRSKVRLDPPVWAATTAYTVRPSGDAGLGSVVKPSAFNDRHFKCTTAGTSDGSEPTWDTTLGNTTADGSVVWTAIRALTVEATVNVVTNNQEFTLTLSTDAPDALLTGGLLTLTSGANNWLKKEVVSWDLGTKKVKIFPGDIFPFTVANGDSLTLTAGSDKSVATTRDTFDNMHNFRGEPYVPGAKQINKYPDSRA